MDSEIEAAKPWVEAVSPSFITLIDINHSLSSLYNMVNVPQAVWIDENGKIVRPTESAGSIDILREFDMEIMGFRPEAVERSAAAKATYFNAVEDWAYNGHKSPYSFDMGASQARVDLMHGNAATAHTKFQLAQFLLHIGRKVEANEIFEECRHLHPDSWNIFRQTSEKTESGIAAGEDFWEKVMSLKDKEYYKKIDMPGMS
tara:strand:- start:20 stop:625 length:606 start_codon:yes stop_codon:yes gene_type:complete